MNAVAWPSDVDPREPVLERVSRRILSAKRLALFLYVQRIKGFPLPKAPHFDAETARRFKEELGKTKLFLEYGSGGSTVWAAEAGVQTISVESDRFFAQVVRNAVSNGGVELLTPKMGATREWGRPLFNTPDKAARYVHAPFRHLKANFPDLVLIDGRYRAACALEVARRAHLASAQALLIMDDYVERPQYHVVEKALGDPELIGRSAWFKVGDSPVSRGEVAASMVQVL